MKPQELFGVVVRTIGLSLVMTSLWAFLLAALTLLSGGVGHPLGMFIYAVPLFIVGIWFLHGAPQIVALAYGCRE